MWQLGQLRCYLETLKARVLRGCKKGPGISIRSRLRFPFEAYGQVSVYPARSGCINTA